MIKVIAELGINHESSQEIAKKLIEYANKSNCWAIKFQYRNLDGFYNSTNEIGDELILDQLIQANFDLSTISTLNDYAKSMGLKTGISFFTLKDFCEIVNSNIKFDFYKIPSAEFSNFELIHEVFKEKKMTILSTGGHTLNQIKTNLEIFKPTITPIIMHCTSNYPTEIGNQNLNVISELKKIKNIKVGYSSHDINYEVNFFAAALGAEYIERHITLDKAGKGLDNSSSSEFNEFKSLNKILNNYDEILGDNKKPINQGEIINLQNLGTSVYSLKNYDEGQLIEISDSIIRAPRKGLTKQELIKYINKPLIKKLNVNDPITKSHFIESSKILKDDLNFMNDLSLSIPIRFHDMEEIFKIFKIKNFEFHLSFKDIENIKMEDFQKYSNMFEGKHFTFHLPDYLNKSDLFDPLSSNTLIKEKSLKILNKLIELVDSLPQEDLFFVSSLSQNCFENKSKFYSNLKNFIDDLYNNYKINFLPQWLPKKAWYFGGSYDINLFSTEEDINFINDFEIDICLDTAHLIMSANSANKEWKDWFNLLINRTKHIHLSDSYGVDGEGVEFGKGELGSPNKILQYKQIKVLEIWQGHLNNFSGFIEAVKDLRLKH